MPNFSAALFSVAVAAGAWWAIGALDESRRPEVVAQELALKPVQETAKIASLYAEALRRDSANPYRWADLGDALAQDHRLPQARYCFQRALELNCGLPQICLRDANFHFGLGETGAALDSAVRVLRTVPDYDAVLFNYFDRMIDGPDTVLAAIGRDRRAAVSYANHLIALGNPEPARTAWHFAQGNGFADNALTAAYIDMLLQKRRYDYAKADWARFTGADFSNPVFNGGFEREPTGAALDWRISASQSFETGIDNSAVHDGKRALHIRFLAGENVNYGNVVQSVLLTPGTYELRAWVRTDRITTDEGPRIQIDGAEPSPRTYLRTESFRGTTDWKPVIQPFVIPPGAGLVSLRVVRAPSGKFDNKIGGDFWLDTVRVVPDKFPPDNHQY